VNVVIRAMDPMDWPAVSEHVHALLVQDTTGIVAVDADTGDLLAAAVFDNWTATSVQIHVTIVNKWVIKEKFIEKVFDYVFNTAGKLMIYGLTPSNNEASLKFNKHVGFEEVMVMTDAYDVGIDYIVTVLHRDNCKWIDHGKEKRSSSST